MSNHKHTSSDSEGGSLLRFGVSMPENLLDQFDGLIATQGYTNRSEAIRDLVRDRLVQTQWENQSGEVVGTVVMVYDHEMRLLSERLTGLQHHQGHLVVSSMHVHLNDRDCLETVVLKGSASKVRDLANLLLSQKGVKHGKLVMTGIAEHSTS